MSYYLEIIPTILNGLSNTLSVFFMTFIVSIPLGSLIALIYTTEHTLGKRIVSLFTWILRGSPLMLQLIFAMFGLPALLNVSFRNRLLVGMITFIINYTAYFVTIFQNALAIIPQGQWDACKMLQLSKVKTLFKVIFPQMYRNSLKSIENETVSLLKDTSLISTIALNDILRSAKDVLSRDQRIESLFIVLVLYLLFSFIIIQSFKYFQRRVRLT